MLKANSPVRVQWDPERDLQLKPLTHRAIQIGLGKIVVDLYVNEWIEKITDVTDVAHATYRAIEENDVVLAKSLVPTESIYPYIPNRRP